MQAATSHSTRSLPAFPGYLRLIGPGLIWMALAQGSSELIWWPYIVAKYGLAFLFLLIPACLLQFPVVFEIGRYTVLTGEGIFHGFFRLNKAFGILLWVLCTVSFLWFGAFASAGGTALASLTGFPASLSPAGRSLFWGQLSIVVFTLAILYARRVYVFIEWVMRIVAAVSLAGMTLACLHPSVRAHVGAFARGLFIPDRQAMAAWDPADSTVLLTAVAWVGLGGFWTLFYSYWIKEKGVAMAAHAQKLTGFRSGVAAIRMGEAALPADEPGAASRLRQWYRYLAVETLIGIVGNLATTILACLLAFAILHPRGLVPKDWDLAVVQAEFFAQWWGEPGRRVFLFIAGAFLADTWLGTVDGVARLHLDALTTLWPKIAERDLRPWYYGIVLLLAAITSITMFFNPPGKLMLLTAVLGFVGTVIYCGALLVLNHVRLTRELPPGMRSGRWSLAGIALATVIYAVLAVLYFAVK